MKLKTELILFIFIFLVGPYSHAVEKDYKFFKDIKTKIKNPFKLRDPFKRSKFKSKKKKRKKFSLLKDGSFTNLPDIGQTPLRQIKVVGILLGGRRRAMVKIQGRSGSLGKEVFILKEGMKVGKDDAEVKAILPGGIVVVEKITNVYDQNEYLETIIPVSTE